MTEYGYIENGILFSRFIEPIVRNYLDEYGRTQTETISVEAQVDKLSPEWKPVDTIDEAEMESGGDGVVVIPKPYDAGDHIAYRYERKRDVKSVQDEIQALKDSLAESDYKITKCYEAFLIGAKLPYDVEELHTQRQAERDKINELEASL
jgi:rRNA maturation protein Nop10